jgi:hypothetical protein
MTTPNQYGDVNRKIGYNNNNDSNSTMDADDCHEPSAAPQKSRMDVVSTARPTEEDESMPSTNTSDAYPNDLTRTSEETSTETMGDATRREKVMTLLDESAAVVVARRAGEIPPPTGISPHDIECGGHREVASALHGTMGDTTRRDEVRTLLEESAASVASRRAPEAPLAEHLLQIMDCSGPGGAGEAAPDLLCTVGDITRRVEVEALREESAAAANVRDTAAVGASNANGLAVAVQVRVQEGDDACLFPEAIESLPKTPLFESRRFRNYSILSMGLLVVTLLSGVFFIRKLKKGGAEVPESPTVAPTTWREGLGIQEYLQEFLREEGWEDETLLDPTTNAFRALNWILHDDPRQLDTADLNLIQRFLHVLLFFSTGGALPGEGSRSTWLSCNPPALDKRDDYFCSFNRFEDETYTSVPAVRWLSGYHECGWAGVTCDEYNNTRGLQLGRFARFTAVTFPCTPPW